MWEGEGGVLLPCVIQCLRRSLVYVCVCVRILQLMCLVGEGFDNSSDEVCGAVVNVRPKGDKISIWTGHAKNEKDNMVIG